MGTHCRPLPAVLRGAAGTVLLVLAACSSDGGNPGTRVLSGLVNVARFEVAPGERVQCTGDVTVQCQSAAIAGELYSSDGRQAGGDAPDITIEATGEIVLTGRILTGHGAGGAEQGGDGGSIRLASSTGSLTIGSAAGARGRAEQPVLQTGNGGNGADGLLGGAGGDGGVIRLEAPAGVLTVHQRPGLIQVGDGGHGGRGVVAGEDLLTFTPPSTLPNAGGDSGGIAATWGSVVGAELVDNPDAPPAQVVVLDEGVGTGGVGGDAGDFFLGVDPVTGASTWPAPARSAGPPARTGRALVEVVGSDGGQGATRGGDGTEVNISYRGAPVPPGENGTSVRAEGGRAGSAISGTGLFDLLWPSNIHGGDGGKAVAAGGDGGAGAGCGASSGDGGSASAKGGQGGYGFGGVGHSFQGRGGDALARGGNGGAGVSCCDPPGQGGNGGRGGDATARGGRGPTDELGVELGPGGDAYALGGDGGPGGDGLPPGGNYVGGGIADAKGGESMPPGTVKLKQNGAHGDDGKPCPGSPPPVVDEAEPNDTAETATPMGTADSGRGSVDKVNGDPCDFFLKTLPAGSYEIQATQVDGQVGLVAIWLGTQLLKVETDLTQPVPFPLSATGDVAIQFGAAQADRNEYTFQIERF